MWTAGTHRAHVQEPMHLGLVFSRFLINYLYCLLKIPFSTLTIRMLWYVTKGTKRIAVGAIAIGSIYAFDELRWYRVVRRSFRAGAVGMYTIINYKFLWTPENAPEVNSRVAKAISNVCLENEGLYVKIGQAINSMAAILPKEYTENLSRLLDKAKTYEYAVIERIVERELGPGIVINVDPDPVGSASLAQVHKGTLAATGQTVAIKVQKPNVSMQAYWDLWMYRLIVRLLEISFGVPLYWTVGFTTSHFIAELDFRREAENSELSRRQFADLGDLVYVPEVLGATEHVLITEWVEDAIMISDVKKLRARNYDCKRIIMDATHIFGHQIFKTGHVHCDPHFGNLLIRGNPNKPNAHQVVLIDHGLYVDLPDKLRREYARLWVAMAPPQDRKTVEEICTEWGIGSLELFQAIIRQGNNRNKEIDSLDIESVPKKTNKQAGTLIKAKFKELLQDTSRFPKELILIGRCMNYIRAANWTHGAPIDRIAVLAEFAREATDEDRARSGGKGWLISLGNYVLSKMPGRASYHKEIE